MAGDQDRRRARAGRDFDSAASAQVVIERRSAYLSMRFAENERIATIKARSEPPAICGPEIPAAPARGAFIAFQPRRIVPGSAGTAVPDGYRGPGEPSPRSAVRAADVFDRMIEDARRRHERRGGDDRFTPPLSPGQVAMGRIYRDLIEDHDGKGMRCASLETGRGGSGDGFIDAFVAQGAAIERIRARIGRGIALKVRRMRQSARGGTTARPIRDRTLVDMVCLMDMTPSDVLRKHGWSAKGSHREAVRSALASALDRMQGYRD